MGGPPPEMTITLCNITAPKLERWKGNDRYVKCTFIYLDYFPIFGLSRDLYKFIDNNLII